MKFVESLWSDPFDVLKRLLDYCYVDDSFGYGQHITRFGYYHQIEHLLADSFANFTAKQVLDISSSLSLLDVLPLEKDELNITSVNYPEYALPSTGLPSGCFDLILCDQVLEHVKGSPWLVADELRRLLSPGGVCLLTTVFMMPLHPYPSDFLRYSSESLVDIFVNDEISNWGSGAWGNRAVWMLSELGYRWEPVPKNVRNPIFRLATMNEPGAEIATWIVFQKKA